MLALVTLFLLGSGAATPDRDPALVFKRSCMVCHGPDGTGKGQGGTRLPGRNLADARWQVGHKDEVLVASILELSLIHI